MKLYKRNEFMALPPGVIFCKGSRWSFGSLHVKHDTVYWEGAAIDWFDTDLSQIEFNGTEDLFDALEDMDRNGSSYPMDTGMSRDGCFEDDDVFLVLGYADLMMLQELAQYAMTVTPKEE